MVARVDSGGCDAQGESLFQPLSATPTLPGQPPVAPVLGLPVTLPELLPKGPGLPGGIDLPGLPIPIDSGDGPPGAAAARCPGANTPVRRNVASMRAARRALLCSLNSVRRRGGSAACA